jgi:receptor protein-tyrosine kinase
MDASVIAARTDGVVICSRYEHTRTDHILKSLKGMHDVGAKIIGFVFTFAPEHEHVPYGNESIYGQKRLAGTPKK